MEKFNCEARLGRSEGLEKEYKKLCWALRRGPSLSSSISLPCFQLNYKILTAVAGSHTTAVGIHPAPGLQQAVGQEAMLPLTLRPLATLPLKIKGDSLCFLRAFFFFF